MNTISKVEAKLEAFIRKYYKNQLLRGILFFMSIGLSYLLIILLIEYFLWLRPAGRAFLFWSFVLVEGILLYRFLLVPLARLFKLSKGIDYKEASIMIGTHFPEVSDKLVNSLELKSQGEDSELVLASIAQKEKELEPVPFSLAIDYRKNLKYLKYAVIPVCIFILINFVGGTRIFNTSYERMVNYDQAYEPPAPFAFFLLDTSALETIEDQNYTVRVKASGELIPDNAQVIIDGDTYFMSNEGGGIFSYVIEQPEEDVNFYIAVNDVRSSTYQLSVLKAPRIEDFKMHLKYPSYTQKSNELIDNTGSVLVPEGTQIEWELHTSNTDEIVWRAADSIFNFTKSGANRFLFSSVFTRSKDYNIATSNEKLEDYEDLKYSIEVVKDAYPNIEVSQKIDTLNGLQHYLQGNVSDDYGLTRLQLIYFKDNDQSTRKIVKLAVAQANVDQFISAFPDTLQLEPGISYTYYYEVTDNDAINNYKSSRSSSFSYKKMTEEERKDKQLQQQQETLSNLDKNLTDSKKNEQELKKISQMQMEGNNLNYNQQQELKNYLQRQQQQKQMMQKYSERLKKNLEDFQEDSEGENSAEELQKRIEASDKRLEQQEDLLNELEDLREKLNKEQLSEKLDKLSKQNKNSEKSLEQLLELTKRFYVEQKMEQLTSKVQELAKKQEQLPRNENNNSENQEKLNKNFEDIQDSFNEVLKENEKLQKPMNLPEEKSLREDISKDQKEAQEQLEKSEEKESQDQEASQDGQKKKENEKQSENSNKSKKNAEKKQQRAADKMKQLSQKMKAQMSQNESQTLEEDTAMLRQVLDNLVLFSFHQEDLMEDFDGMDNDNPSYARKLVYQNSLKENFEHIDDSLFALSLRVPQLEETISEELTNIDYSLNQSLERFAENKVPQGVASQQYVITGANTLADMLSSILNNMQDQLSGSGSGQGGKPKPGAGGAGEQLSDIIMSQEQLSEQMGEGKQKGAGEQGKSSKGEPGEEGQQGNEGEGNQGESGGSNGQDGEGMSEEQRAAQYEIYKKQQQLRDQLQNILQDRGLDGDGGQLLKEMENLEDQLLDSGLNEASRKQMEHIKHQLMKLKDAVQEQGEEEQREAQTNQQEFSNTAKSIEKEAKKYFNVKELLNRDPLPLNNQYKIRVQQYFSKSDD